MASRLLPSMPEVIDLTQDDAPPPQWQLPVAPTVPARAPVLPNQQPVPQRGAPPAAQPPSRPLAVRTSDNERPEPPAKRAKLSPPTGMSATQNQLTECILRQICPAVERLMRPLPDGEYNKPPLAHRLVSLLSGQEFLDDWQAGGRKWISRELEQKLAVQAALLFAREKDKPEFRRPSLLTPALVPVPAPAPSGTPNLPTPSYTPLHKSQQQQDSSPAFEDNGGMQIDPPSDEPAGEPTVVPDIVSDIAGPDLPFGTQHTRPSTPPRPLPHRVGKRRGGERPRHGQAAQTTPQTFRSQARAAAWRLYMPFGADLQEIDSCPEPSSRWYSLTRRPYRTADERSQIVRGSARLQYMERSTLQAPHVFHVDFTAEEIEELRKRVRTHMNLPLPENKPNPVRDLAKLARKNDRLIARLLPQLSEQVIGRDEDDIGNFITDLANREISNEPRVLTIERDEFARQEQGLRANRVPALLFAREVWGFRGFGHMRRLENFTNEFRKANEDGLERRIEWSDCAGDITTLTWVSNEGFIAGTTAHSDPHNQQYNKTGNLLLGSAALGTLRTYPDHRIVRPLVEQGENARETMRHSQDPWLFSSVVSSDYDPAHDRAFTSGFDRTTKVWKIEKSGRSMELLGTWPHKGNVNFVMATKHASGMVATASDVPTAAVRIYTINEHDISGSPHRSFSCSRALDVDGNPMVMDKWAFFPATMAWGRFEKVRELLLVGYSPRSLTSDDNDIPEEKRNSGEICIWNCLTGERVKVNSASSQNVFEVVWHPSQPSFVAATAPAGLNVEDGVRTQIRIFRPADSFGQMVQDLNQVQAFAEVKTLDCWASDINELTIMPNSFTFCYITAGCTDGKVYVWDTAHGDKPVHVLCHGEPHDGLIGGDREREDVGVKFTAWGTTPDRLYTGGSDGSIKVWNVRTLREPLVRDVVNVSGSVSFGCFSPDHSRLAIGDATGRVHILSVDEEEKSTAHFKEIPMPTGTRMIRRPRPCIKHPEPPPPTHDAEGNLIVRVSGRDAAKEFLERGQMVMHPLAGVGALQGPNYAETGLFRKEAHLDEDPALPLMAEFEVQQQESLRMFPGRRRDLVRFRELPAPERAEELHRHNTTLDLDVGALDEETRLELMMERVELGSEVEYGFNYEDEDDYDELGGEDELALGDESGGGGDLNISR